MNTLTHNLLMNCAVPTRLRLLRRILSRQFWNQERIKAYQEEQLKTIISYCWEYVPFYKKRWKGYIATPADVQTIEDLQKLPILTKDEVREDQKALETTAKGIKSSKARTGGSTGRPIIFRMTKYDEELAWAQMYTGWTWAGYRIGDPFLVVGGESVGVGLSDNRTWQDVIINRWVTSGSNLTVDRARQLADSRYFHRIRFMYGYPNAIRELGELFSELNVRPKTLKGIVCTAEVMRQEVRERISEIFDGVLVLDQYGLNDGGLHACEGPEQDGLYLSFHRGILEILDDKDRQITTLKQTGRAIATCFSNLATPFIRYETGDQLHWYSRGGGTTTGINWPKIGPVDGRMGDVIYLPSGRRIAMPGLTLVMRWIEGLNQYQFIQDGPNSVVARIDRGKGFTMSELEIRHFLKNRIAEEINWSVEWGTPVLTENGKLLIIRNDWLRRQGLLRPPAVSSPGISSEL